ncbi:MAG: GNAT family N-acetyltransferase [Gemmatimonadetes bacterium]|nr:GNAT family N-acetyltransferase [Gemmatimonadota bacterium]
MTGATGEGGVRIRDARADEREAIRELTMRAYSQYATIMAPTAWAGLREALVAALALEGGAERIVAERDGRLVGSVMLYPPETDAYGGLAAEATWPELRLLAVDPEARGLGVGAALVDECVRRARASGASALGLHTSRSMEAAIRMYERLGFVRAPEHDFHPEGAEVVWGYRLDLDDAPTSRSVS